LIVRIAYLFAAHPDPASLVGDEPDFFETAANLVAGRGYAMVPQQSPDGLIHPTANRPPGPSAVLAVAFAVFGPSVLVARLTCAAAASAAAPLVYAVTKRIGGSDTTALSAGALACVYPSWVYYSVMILSESVYIPALLGVLLITDRVVRSRAPVHWVLLGCAWGCAALVRPHALPCCALICAVVLGKWPALFSRVLLLGVGLGAVLGTWTARNYIEIGHPVLLATEGGETFLGANNPYVWNDPAYSGLWQAPVAIPEYRDHLQPIRDEVERDREQNRIGMAFVRENVASVPGAMARKLWRWLTPVPHTGGRVRALVLASYTPLLVFLFLGAVRGGVPRDFMLLMALAVTAASFAITAVYWGNLVRGRLPLELLWLPWAAVSASAWYSRLTRRQAAGA